MASAQDAENIRNWLEAWYAVGDKCVPSNSIKWFAEDCVVQFNNGPPVRGKAAAQSEFSSIAPAIQYMSHEILTIDVVGNRIYNECNVTYIAKGDPEQKPVTMHRMNVYERERDDEGDDWKITKWMAFFDSTPLKERMALSKTGMRVY